MKGRRPREIVIHLTRLSIHDSRISAEVVAQKLGEAKRMARKKDGRGKKTGMPTLLLRQAGMDIELHHGGRCWGGRTFMFGGGGWTSVEPVENLISW